MAATPSGFGGTFPGLQDRHSRLFRLRITLMGLFGQGFGPLDAGCFGRVGTRAHIGRRPLPWRLVGSGAGSVAASAHFQTGSDQPPGNSQGNQEALSHFDSSIGTLIPGYRSPASIQSFLEQGRSGQTRDTTGFSLEEGIEKGIFLVGSPESVVEQLKRKKEESRINVLMSFMRFGAMPKAMAFSSIELFAEEVLPKVRDL